MLPPEQAAQAHFGCGFAQHRRAAEPIADWTAELQISFHQRTLLQMGRPTLVYARSGRLLHWSVCRGSGGGRVVSDQEGRVGIEMPSATLICHCWVGLCRKGQTRGQAIATDHKIVPSLDARSCTGTGRASENSIQQECGCRT